MRNEISILCIVVLGAGCRAVAPGESEERSALEEAGAPFEKPFEERELPEVRADSPYPDLLYRALRADPKAERAYFAWAAALERAVIAGSPPQPVFGLGWMFTEPLGGFFQNILAAASLAIPAPNGLSAAARAALDESRAARATFESMAFERRGRFRATYSAFDRAARELEIAERDRAFLDDLQRSISSRVSSGASTADEWLRMTVELERAADTVAAARAELRLAAARVNAAMSRDAYAPLDPPPPLRPLPLEATDVQLLRLASRRNPEVREILPRIRARADEVTGARAENESDLGLQYNREGTDDMPMLTFSLPLRRDRVHAAVAAAEATLRATLAERREIANRVGAETATAIYDFREAERRRAFFAERVRPPAEETLRILVARYGAGGAAYLDVIEARRALLEIDRAIERARTDREMAIGDLLACCGADVSASAEAES